MKKILACLFISSLVCGMAFEKKAEILSRAYIMAYDKAWHTDELIIGVSIKPHNGYQPVDLFLPISELQHLKEDDTFSITHKETVYKCICKQKNTRTDWQTFQEALEEARKAWKQ